MDRLPATGKTPGADPRLRCSLRPTPGFLPKPLALLGQYDRTIDQDLAGVSIGEYIIYSFFQQRL